jgi:hypothetical protein
MKRLRPLAGALLATLMIVSAVSAAEVELILPGGDGDTRTTETAETGPAGTVPREEPLARREKRDRPEPVLQTRHFGSMIELTCAVGDRPDAIVVVNHSEEPLPKGTRIKWQLQSDGLQGFFRLLGPLEGGGTLVADNVLTTSVQNGAACVARVI